VKKAVALWEARAVLQVLCAPAATALEFKPLPEGDSFGDAEVPSDMLKCL
jgi:hypothetical protein